MVICENIHFYQENKQQFESINIPKICKKYKVYTSYLKSTHIYVIIILHRKIP